MIERLAWVTTGPARSRDEDEPTALAALRSAGLRVDVVDWDDTTVDWSIYDRAVLRSTWDYSQRLEEFLSWVTVVDGITELRNPAAMVRWGVGKRAEAVAGLSAAETRAPHHADPDQLRVARAAIDTVTARFGVPTYARVDLVRDLAGQPCVLEVELAEPCLFLPQASSDALTRLVDTFTGR